jgi:Toastrack DUF4097
MRFCFIGAVLGACLLSATAVAQMQNNTQPMLQCNDVNGGDSARYCEMRQQTIAYPGQLNIDGGRNGGVSVKGWDRADVLVRMKVTASAQSDNEAKTLVSQVQVSMNGGRIAASGPAAGDHQWWSVSYEIFAPHQANVEIATHNGGVHIADIGGNIEFAATNGGVHLARLAGNVHGHTTNGGVHIELAGSRWDGAGMDVTTTNGGVHVEMPTNYSAHLDTSTANGGLHVDGLVMPLSAAPEHGRRPRQLSTDVGSGGATLHFATTNGGVHVSRS